MTIFTAVENNTIVFDSQIDQKYFRFGQQTVQRLWNKSLVKAEVPTQKQF